MLNAAFHVSRAMYALSHLRFSSLRGLEKKRCSFDEASPKWCWWLQCCLEVYGMSACGISETVWNWFMKVKQTKSWINTRTYRIWLNDVDVTWHPQMSKVLQGILAQSELVSGWWNAAIHLGRMVWQGLPKCSHAWWYEDLTCVKC